MPSRKIEVQLSVSFKVAVQDEATQPARVPINENFNNAGTTASIAPKQDQDSTTLVVPPAGEGPGTKSIDLSNLGTIDYMFIKGDAPFTVKFGEADAIPVTSIMVKDGALPEGVTEVVIGNMSSTASVNITYSFLGH